MMHALAGVALGGAGGGPDGAAKVGPSLMRWSKPVQGVHAPGSGRRRRYIVVEWRRVLMASMLKVHEYSKFINLRDSLLLNVVAANDAIMAFSSANLASSSFSQRSCLRTCLPQQPS